MTDIRLADLATPMREPTESLPRFETALVPRNSISGRSLVAVVAIMTFLASLTTGAAMLVGKAAGEWQSDISREITIQVVPATGRDLDAAVDKAVSISRAFAGIVDVRPYTKEESAKLLEPWLGSGTLPQRIAGATFDRGQDCVRCRTRSRTIEADACRSGSGCHAR